MTTEVNNLIARFNQLETQFTTLKSDLIAYVQGQTSTVGGNLPPVTAPPPQYEFDINGMLAHARAHGGGRVDPVVGADCPHTRVMPKTGHVLSVARPDLGEMFVGYCQRVADQATGGQGDKYLGTIGSLFLGTGTFFDHGTPGVPFQPNGGNWPEAADCFYNMVAYMTDDEKARDARTKAEWAQWDIDFRNRHNPPPPQPPAPPPELPPGEEPL